MRTILTNAELRAALQPYRGSEKKVGFVPTMGALHDGHLSLIRLSTLQTDVTVVSIFVNPRQFGQSEDFETYPRPVEEDIRKLAEANVDFLFLPSTTEIYPTDASTNVVVSGSLTKNFEGAIRPGHFEGVATVVNILFNVVQPDIAYFGQKDVQQVAVIKRMVRDLAMPVEISVGNIIREGDGLALSSRNQYLDSREKSEARAIYAALKTAADAVAQGATFSAALGLAKSKLQIELQHAQLDYLAFIDSETFQTATSFEGRDEVVLAVALKIGSTRLIDNMIIGKPPKSFIVTTSERRRSEDYDKNSLQI